MDFIINLLLQYQSAKYVGIILMIIGTLYVSLILLRGFLEAFVLATHTSKDDKVVKAMYNFLDKYSIAFEKTTTFSKVNKKK